MLRIKPLWRRRCCALVVCGYGEGGREALEAADQAISLAPDKIWLDTTRAYALMFLDRVDEARALYLKYRGQQKVLGDKSLGGGDRSKISPSYRRRGSRIR